MEGETARRAAYPRARAAIVRRSGWGSLLGLLVLILGMCPLPLDKKSDKLEAALAAFRLDVTGLVCADFGCHAGGFTDCLLRHGAERVYAVDTGYGVLDYRLRTDERVVVMERTNALHCEPPRPVDVVTIDMGWTRQRYAIPAALRWLAPGGRIVSLVKPHYELDAAAT